MKHFIWTFVVSVFVISVHAKSVEKSVTVLSSPNPQVSRQLNAATLIDLERRLGPNRWVENRSCRLKVEKRLLERKFLSGSYHGDALFLDFETDHLGPRSQQATITSDSTWGSRLITDAEFGPVEDVRIELNDLDGTWIQFRHTGTHLVQFEIGNIRGITLCLAH